jgi:hypothetical protein
MDKDQICDCCDKPATKEFSGQTCKYAASWLLMHLCDECYENHFVAFKAEFEANHF